MAFSIVVVQVFGQYIRILYSTYLRGPELLRNQKTVLEDDIKCLVQLSLILPPFSSIIIHVALLSREREEETSHSKSKEKIPV